ncbi:MAG TPA: class I SAM-dependent methyltransferase [Actinoplanes sp.]|nr:class I SAM-dependent methyltransferase [Actinoplanes sp.]
MPSTTLDPVAHRAAWTRMMTGYLPGLADLEQAITTTTERLTGPPARVLDLGGGPGLLAEHLATRWPSASVTLADLDPVLLALARSALPVTVTVTEADLTDPSWPTRTGSGFDLVTAVMTVHYLNPAAIRSLYATIRRILHPGGLLVVADVMPDDGLPALMRALAPAPGPAWSHWWSALAAAPEFGDLMHRRAEIFRSRPPAEFTPALSWHAAAARAAGFAEAGALWRHGRHAALAAI